MRVALILTVTALLSACSTWEAKRVPCPVRPILEPFTAEELYQMEVDTMDKIAVNQIRLKEYAKKLEIRAGCER